MGLEGKRIATGRAEAAPTLPYKTPNGCYFRNGDAAVKNVTLKDAVGNSVVITGLQAGQIVDWMFITEITSTTATVYEIYSWK
jgi:hypothetical protein